MHAVKTLLFILTLLLTGCGAAPDARAGDTGALELKVYQVPDGFQEELAEVANRAFSAVSEKDQLRVARVEVLPNGDLALLAPASIHKGFAELAAKVKERRPSGPNNATIDCWVLLGMRDGKDEPLAEELTELNAVLDQLNRGGVGGFRLLEKFRLSSSLGASARATGKYLEFNQNLSMVRGRVVADLRLGGIRGVISDMRTRLHLEPGKFVVIGESTFSYGDSPQENESLWAGEISKSPTLYYIIRASFDERR